MNRIVWTNEAAAQVNVVKVFACVLSSAPLMVVPTVTNAAEQPSIFADNTHRHSSPEWADITRRLELFSALGDAWDGQGAARVNAIVLDRARQAVAKLQTVGAPVPTLGLASDGEVDLVWDDEERSASVAFLRNGEVLLFAYDPEWEAPYRSSARTFDPRDLEPVLEVVERIEAA